MNSPVTPLHPPYRTSGLAIASLVLGILGTGIPAIITGHMARARIRRESGLVGDGFALAGLILGYITTVLIGIAVVLGVIVGLSGGIAESARLQAADAKMREIEAKLETYRMIAGNYPSTTQGLQALVVEPTTDPVPRRWKQQFAVVPVDPWGAAYRYEFDPATGLYTIGSNGPDGIAGTSDDI